MVKDVRLSVNGNGFEQSLMLTVNGPESSVGYYCVEEKDPLREELVSSGVLSQALIQVCNPRLTASPPLHCFLPLKHNLEAQETQSTFPLSSL